jgi:hypothetical protein
MPLMIKLALSGPKEFVGLFSSVAISPDRWGPVPSSAIALRYCFSFGVNLSKRTRKKLSSSAAIASMEADLTS